MLRYQLQLRIAAITLIVIAAAMLRFYALGDGIPYALQVDEPEIMERAVAIIKTGDFNPRFFDYPGFVIYAQAGVAALRFLSGAAAGEWRALSDVVTADFYLSARGLTATLGTLTVLLLYLAGRRWGTTAALVGAALFAAMPYHVRESHWVLADVPATCLAVLTFLLSLRADEQPTLARLALAGGAAGLTIGAKYNAGVVLFVPLIAAIFANKSWQYRLWSAALVMASAIGAFLLVAPYTLLNLAGFLDGFDVLAGSYQGTPIFDPWVKYWKYLWFTMFTPAQTLGVVGLGITAVQLLVARDRARWAMLVVVPLTYFPFIANQSLIFGRYLLPMLPFAALLAAVALAVILRGLARLSPSPMLMHVVVAAAVIVTLYKPALSAFDFDRGLNAVKTQTLVKDWVDANVPAGATIVIEGVQLRSWGRYNIEHLAKSPGLAQFTPDHYVDRGVQYVIAMSDAFGQVLAKPEEFPDRYARYQAIFGRFELVYTVTGPTMNASGPDYRIYRVR